MPLSPQHRTWISRILLSTMVAGALGLGATNISSVQNRETTLESDVRQLRLALAEEKKAREDFDSATQKAADSTKKTLQGLEKEQEALSLDIVQAKNTANAAAKNAKELLERQYPLSKMVTTDNLLASAGSVGIYPGTKPTAAEVASEYSKLVKNQPKAEVVVVNPPRAVQPAASHASIDAVVTARLREAERVHQYPFAECDAWATANHYYVVDKRRSGNNGNCRYFAYRRSDRTLWACVPVWGLDRMGKWRFLERYVPSPVTWSFVTNRLEYVGIDNDGKTADCHIPVGYNDFPEYNERMFTKPVRWPTAANPAIVHLPDTLVHPEEPGTAVRR